MNTQALLTDLTSEQEQNVQGGLWSWINQPIYSNPRVCSVNDVPRYRDWWNRSDGLREGLRVAGQTLRAIRR